uniref:Chromodomain-helicase-DNA-binding protein 6-like n=1 Tax=Callorhinchus milii TaxID=7868 RepID=A0A4W3HIK7_CALMI
SNPFPLPAAIACGPSRLQLLLAWMTRCYRGLGTVKRRSGRQVKRRKYNEDMDFKVVDDDGETIAVLGAGKISPSSGSSQKGTQTTVRGSVEAGGREILCRLVAGGTPTEVEEFYVKYRNYSYLHCKWATVEELEKDKRIHQKIKRFRTKLAQMKHLFLETDDEPFNPDYVEVDRILDVAHTIDTETGEPVIHYLVKWCSLPYEESTWELVEDIDPVKIQDYELLQIMPEDRPIPESWQKLDGSRDYRNENELREYQLEGMNWLLFNWYNRKNCILADEMGLGKTIQSITFLYEIYLKGMRGPFLIIAPLSTIANWEREFRTWTEINVIVYHGSQISRQMIHQYEMHYKDTEGAPIQGIFKFSAIITTFEMILADCPELRKIQWRCVIIDEAHRLKNKNCKLLEGLKLMGLEHKVLLTGTPLQNTVEELFSLLNFLEPTHFPSENTFLEEFGDLKTDEQVKKLQAVLKPMMLRRLKDDVEKNLAPKEETIIEVELTNIQKKYYRAILERNFSFLAKGANQANMPNLLNTMMELRKCCNHPYLINGAEEKILDEFREVRSPEAPDYQLQAMIQAAGKLVLIDKLLPKLIAGGHKVLIFSQMVRCLDILEDYLIHRRYTYERIDGRVRGNLRQAAIDRFSKPDSDRFVFLLCTRAGGLGINLTAADTCIIFDSDWNPQNDLQAQARCHRIGQSKAVQVYRLITRNSYEREMFDKASLKLGLDRAVLQAMNRRGSTNGVQPLSKIEVEDLLRKGAYGALMDEEDEGSKFCEEDIDQILLRRTRTITIESEGKGSTFAKASFVASGNRTDISLDDPNFWQKWAKIAELEIESKNGKDSLVIDTPRVRKQTKHYNSFEDDELMEFSELDSDTEDRPCRSRRLHDKTRRYLRAECFRVEKNLLIFGWGRWKDILSHGRFKWHLSEKDMETICRTLLVYCLKHYKGDEKIKSFIWDLITPTKDGQNQALHNHSGLSAPVPRGRKGKKVKTPLSQPEVKNADWVASCNPDVLFHDDGYKKHLKQHCNKVLLRVRMLYYLKQEVLGEAADKALEGTDAGKLDVWIPEADYTDIPVEWWDGDADKSLLMGVYKHGYERYNAMRADPSLCFLDRVGMPDETSLAAEQGGIDLTADMAEGQETSPLPPHPPSHHPFPDSLSSTLSLTRSCTLTHSTHSLSHSHYRPQWPVASVLTARLRRLITTYQRCNRKELVRMESLARNNRRRWFPQEEIWGRIPEMEAVTMDPQRWTRREQTDFYRVVSTFGIVYDPDKKLFDWNQFRSFARLERKTDQSLERYFHGFVAMCRGVCRLPVRKEPSDAGIFVEPITEERASRTLYRIELLRKLREQVLRHPHMEERLKLCRPSLYLPVWWECSKHDRDLLLGAAKHGLSRTDYYILNDNQLSFREAHRNYVQNGNTYYHSVPAPYSQSSLNPSQSASPASTVPTLGDKDTQEQTDAEQEKADETLEDGCPEPGLEIKSEGEGAAQICEKPPEYGVAGCDLDFHGQCEPVSDVASDSEVSSPRDSEEKSEDGSQPEVLPLKSFDEESNTSASLAQDELQDCLVQEAREPTIAQLLQEKTLYSSAEWPKDRVIINRIDNICHVVLKGKWPSAQQQNLEPQGVVYSVSSPPDSLNLSNYLSIPVQAASGLSFPDTHSNPHPLTKESLLNMAFPRDQRRRRRKYEFETERGAKRKSLEEVGLLAGRSHLSLNGWQDTAMDLSKASEEVLGSVPVIISGPKLAPLDPAGTIRTDMAGILQAGLIHPVTGQVINGALRGEDARRRRGRRKNVEGLDILFMKEKKPEALVKQEIIIIVVVCVKEVEVMRQPFSTVGHASGMMIKLPVEKQRAQSEEEQKNKSMIEWLRQHPTYTMDVSSFTPVSPPIIHGISDRPKQRRHRCKDPSKLDINTLTGEERVPVIHRGSGRKLGGAMAPLMKELARWLDGNPDYAVAPEWAEIVKHSGFLPETKFNRILTEPVVKEAGSRKRGRRPRSEVARGGVGLTETASAMGPVFMNGLIAGMDLVNLQSLRNVHNLQLAGLMGFPAGFAAIPAGEETKNSLSMLPMMGVAGMSHMFGVGGLLSTHPPASSSSTLSTLRSVAASKEHLGGEEPAKHKEGSSGDKPGPSSHFPDPSEARVTTSNPLSFNPFLLHGMPAGLIYPSMFLPHGIGMAMTSFPQPAGRAEGDSAESPKKKRKKAREEPVGTEVQEASAQDSTEKAVTSPAVQGTERDSAQGPADNTE